MSYEIRIIIELFKNIMKIADVQKEVFYYVDHSCHGGRTCDSIVSNNKQWLDIFFSHLIIFFILKTNRQYIHSVVDMSINIIS